MLSWPKALGLLASREVSPIVAWPALTHPSASGPSVVVLLTILSMLLTLVALLASLVFRCAARIRLGRVLPSCLPSLALAQPSSYTPTYTFALIPSSFTLTLPTLPSPPLQRYTRVLSSILARLRTVIENSHYTYGLEFLRAYDTYKYSLDDFLNMTRLCRELQEQLKDRDARLLHHTTASHDLSVLSMQHAALTAHNEALRVDKTRLKAQLRAERATHADDLRAFQRDLVGLATTVEALEKEREVNQRKYDDALNALRDENASLRTRLLAVSRSDCPTPSVPTVPEAHVTELQRRVASAERAVRHVTKENDALREELVVAKRLNEEKSASQREEQEKESEQRLKEQEQSQKEQEQRQKEQEQRKTQAAWVDALERFRSQLVEQQAEYGRLQAAHAREKEGREALEREREALAAKVAKVKADKSKIKAKLKHARADAESKSAAAARLQDDLVEQAASFVEDLRFAHLESHFERAAHSGALTRAEAESSALRTALQDLFARHRAREAACEGAQGRMRAVDEERRVARHLEDMLVEELRKRRDEYETLEISFEVLEAAYGFLARELVKTEHALREALGGEEPCIELELFRSAGGEKTEEDALAEMIAEAEAENAELEKDSPGVEAVDTRADKGKGIDYEPEYEPTDVEADTDAEDDMRTSASRASLASVSSASSSASTRSFSLRHVRTPSRRDTLSSHSSHSSRSSLSSLAWPATPALVRTPDGSRAGYGGSFASGYDSPVVATPPLPALLLPRLPRAPVNFLDGDDGADGDGDVIEAEGVHCASPFPRSPDDDLFNDRWSDVSSPSPGD
ncbi:hypothetical protein EIP86_003421 [Pleurotus ostreatoroseus]|nr:hypothetical protein EIP86_003421 [Pleurotus ostreatoroseus]